MGPPIHESILHSVHRSQFVLGGFIFSSRSNDVNAWKKEQDRDHKHVLKVGMSCQERRCTRSEWHVIKNKTYIRLIDQLQLHMAAGITLDGSLCLCVCGLLPRHLESVVNKAGCFTKEGIGNWPVGTSGQQKTGTWSNVGSRLVRVCRAVKCCNRVLNHQKLEQRVIRLACAG